MCQQNWCLVLFVSFSRNYRVQLWTCCQRWWVSMGNLFCTMYYTLILRRWHFPALESQAQKPVITLRSVASAARWRTEGGLGTRDRNREEKGKEAQVLKATEWKMQSNSRSRGKDKGKDYSDNLWHNLLHLFFGVFFFLFFFLLKFFIITQISIPVR